MSDPLPEATHTVNDTVNVTAPNCSTSVCAHVSPRLSHTPSGVSKECSLNTPHTISYSLLHQVNAADETNKGVESDFEVSGGDFGLFVPVGHCGVDCGDGDDDQVRFDIWVGRHVCQL